jgi:hypothetical protein
MLSTQMVSSSDVEGAAAWTAWQNDSLSAKASSKVPQLCTAQALGVGATEC